MIKRIIISVTSDLNTDQRVLKVAQSCFNNGYEVLLVGRLLKNSFPIHLAFPYKRFKLVFNNSALFYAEYNIRLFFLLLFSRTQLLLSNDTDTLLANFLVSKIRNIKLVFDAHELFPETPELADRPRIKKIWETLENLIFPHLKHCYTVCNSIALHYNSKYNIPMKVVRNVPYLTKLNQETNPSLFPGKKIILYQGALNTGRGLEWVINAMPHINNAVLLIIGDGDIANELKQQVRQLNLETKVIFTGRIEGNKLYNYTNTADLGLCLLENKGLSYYYSLPNRIFDYIHSGIPVLATRFPEIENIVEKYNTGILIDHYEPMFLANIINTQLENVIDKDYFRTLASTFCWEKEEKILLSILNS